MNRTELSDNPFFVLAISTSATRMEVERAAQKLLAQLAIGVASAKTYRTPFGPSERDEAKVRSALATLRDPEERALSELWFDATGAESKLESSPGWAHALRSIGWRGPCTE